MQETIELNGRTYTVRTEYDAESNPLDCDGHGDVTAWTTRGAMLGEVIIAEDCNSRRYYDMRGAIQKARAEGWNCPPFDVPGETAGMRAVRSAQSDFNYLRGWFSGAWHYVGVIVEDEGGESESLWAVEDSDDAYLDEVALQLAEELDARISRKRERETFPVSTMGV